MTTLIALNHFSGFNTPMPRRLIIGIFLTILPLTASAKSVIEWDFRNGQTPPGKWEVRGFSNVKSYQEGIMIIADKDGYMTTKPEFKKKIDAVILTIQTARDMEAVLLWQEINIAVKGYNQLPFVLEKSDAPQVVDIDLSTLSIWNSRAPEFGIGIPKGAQVLIEKMEFVSYNPIEKIFHGALSLWKFDVYAPQAINFLWGPWLNFNPIARADMYLMDPPLGNSGMWVVYIILAIFGLRAGKNIVKHNQPQAKALVAFLTVVGCLWIVLDLRMGSEILSYALTDWRDHVLKNPGERNARKHRSFHDTAEDAIPTLTSSGSYFFKGPGKTIYFSAMRYLTYPVKPVQSGPNLENTTYGLIFGTNDAVINDSGQLITSDGILHPGPCSIEKEYRDYSFLLRCKQ